MTVIPVTDREILHGLSPYNWVCKEDYLASTVNGASMTLRFKNTRQVVMTVDMDHMCAMAPTHFPIIAWSINSGPFRTQHLVPGEKSVLLTSDVADPVVELYVKGMSPYGERYSGDVPQNSIKITGFSVAEGGKTLPVQFPKKIWLSIGDSIMSGDGALQSERQGRPAEDSWAASDDGRASYGYLLAHHYGYRESRLAYGGYNWTGGMANVPKLTTLIDQQTSTVSRLKVDKLDPLPAIVLINLGENGVPPENEVFQALTKLRSRIARTTRLIVMIPVSGKGRLEISRAFRTYKDSVKDGRAYLVDLGPISYATGDGQHPTAVGHQSIFEKAVLFLDAIVSSNSR